MNKFPFINTSSVSKFLSTWNNNLAMQNPYRHHNSTTTTTITRTTTTTTTTTRKPTTTTTTTTTSTKRTTTKRTTTTTKQQHQQQQQQQQQQQTTTWTTTAATRTCVACIFQYFALEHFSISQSFRVHITTTKWALPKWERLWYWKLPLKKVLGIPVKRPHKM